MSNVVSGKTASASNFVAPFAAARAVDGRTTEIQRWLSNQVPCWISVDLEKEIWIDRWVVVHMAAVASGWANGYQLTDYELQVSLDEANWTTVDHVSKNTAAKTDRKFNAVPARYVRVVVMGGLQINPQMASIVELGVFGAPPTSPYLSNLEAYTLQSQELTLDPAFKRETFDYSISTADDKILLKVTMEDAKAKLMINGNSVTNGAPYEASWKSDNTIEVVVTPVVGEPRTYKITRTTPTTSSYLTDLEIYPLRGSQIQLSPSFTKETLDYTVNSAQTRVRVKATTEEPVQKLTINGQVAESDVFLTVSWDLNTALEIVVTPIAGEPRTYTVSRQ